MKKVLSVLLMVTLVLALVACGGNKGVKVTLYEDTWEDENLKLAVDFYYPEGADITLESDEEYPNWVEMKYESKNIAICPSVFEDTTFDANKEYAKENEDTYEEFKLNGYDCYGYNDFGGYCIYVHFEEVSETTDRYMIINTETIDYGIEGTPEDKAQYEDADIKKIVDSFEYRGVVEYPETEEEK